MEKKYDSSSLWLALSELVEVNIFAIYPKLLAKLLLEEEAARQPGDTSEAERLVLPSDREWRLKQYFFLVELQKTLDNKAEGADGSTQELSEVWAPWNVVAAVSSPNAPPPVCVKTSPGPAWDIAKVLKAAKLLSKPPVKVAFEDEQEMRCVYSLIYDVFRYKSVLDQTIDDIGFFGDYPQYLEHRNLIWLFLMELARRRWAARPRGDSDRAAELLGRAGSPYCDIEATIWDQRVHFAAAIARIRIKNRAFSLADLLPPHLREERISACVNKETVTGWVNTFKAKKVAVLVKRLQELGYSYSGSKTLCAGEYRFDRVCPRFITLRPPAHLSIGQMELVKNGVIVLQEREFCEGASTLCRALRANAITGVVAQTHASSPRCSAYLAAQLRELAAIIKAKTPAAPATPELGKLVVFGAGDKVESYVCALRELGIEASEASQSSAAVYVVSEAVHCETPVVTSALEGVVAVLATPPNSYSAVTDPIDLVCGRGGDLAMLEILTESEVDSNGKARVQSILEEQKKTLKALLSKPQIQLILYETHSALEAENQAQVTRAVAEANRLARERHALLKKKHHTPKPRPETAKTESAKTDTARTESTVSIESDTPRTDRTDVSEANETSSPPKILSRKSSLSCLPMHSRPPSAKENVLVKVPYSKSKCSVSRPGSTVARPIPEATTFPKNPDDDLVHITVPDCDLFEVHKLPTLGNGLDINYILDRDGCYLGLIQRKEITRLDAKYMIRVAEERGLFGGTTSPVPKNKRKEAATAAPKRRRRKTSFEVERIAAPTYASIVRSKRRGSAPATFEDGEDEGSHEQICCKHARRQAAASAIHSNACNCHAHHKIGAGVPPRRGSADVTASVAAVPRPPTPPCRRPFPIVVHELRLRNFGAQQQKLYL